MESMPYVLAVFILLTDVAAILIPLFYTKVVKRRGKKRVRRLTRYNRQLIVGTFTFFVGILSICCTPILIPFADKITNGSRYYPEVATAMVAALLLIYVVITYSLMSITSKIIVKKISSGR